MNISVVAAQPERWDEVVAAFGRRREDPSWCWCQRFIGRLDGVDPPDNRQALRTEIETALIPPGLIAHLDGRPVGWTRVMPRSALPGVLANRAIRRVLPDDPGAWWVTCFAIQPRARGKGVGTALLLAAVDHAAQNGATAVEGHPVDVDALVADHVSAAAVFTGTLAMFRAAGFIEIGRTYPSRPVMRRLLRR